MHHIFVVLSVISFCLLSLGIFNVHSNAKSFERRYNVSYRAPEGTGFTLAFLFMVLFISFIGAVCTS